MNKMVINNLLYRPIRSLISVLAVGFEVLLILLIVGLSLGMLNDSKNRQAGIGADVIVRPPGSSAMVGLSGAPVSIKLADILRKQPHVTAVTPIVTQLASNSALEVIYGIDLESFNAVSGGFRFVEGTPFTGPNDIIVDDFFAASKQYHVGDTLELLNHKFTICGIVENGKGARKFLRIDRLQELNSSQGKASVFYVKLDDSSFAQDVVVSMKKIDGMSDYTVISLKEWLSLLTPSNIPGLSIFINTVVGVSVCIGFIVIFQSMYTAVMERTREIGILKSMGASKAYIVRLILSETVLLTVTGIVFGIVFSITARYGLVQKFPTIRLIIDPGWVLKATIIALIGSVLGAMYPAYRAAQKDPIDALAYE